MDELAEIRSALPDDAEPICAIYNAAIAERGSTFETRPRVAADFGARIDDARFPLLVSDTGDGIVGWAGLGPYSDRQCYAGIGEASVYVDARARGRGVGTALTGALAFAAEESGFHKLLGRLFTDNFASIRLVERCGFDTVGLHRRHGKLDGVWRDVLVVERLLGPRSRPAHLTPSIPVLQANDVLDLRRRDLDDLGVLDGFQRVDERRRVAP